MNQIRKKEKEISIQSNLNDIDINKKKDVYYTYKSVHKQISLYIQESYTYVYYQCVYVQEPVCI